MPLASRRSTIAVMSANVLSAFQPARARTVPAPALRRQDFESLAEHWQRALDAGDRALRAAAGSLPSSYLGPHRRALLQERRHTADLLVRLARELGLLQPPFRTTA
jgi:hypothetical protein